MRSQSLWSLRKAQSFERQAWLKLRVLHAPLFFLALTLSNLGGGSSARAETTMFAGVGPVYAFPGTARLGWDSWEGGILGAGVYGVDKVIRFGAPYAAWGFVLTAQDSWGVGFYGAMGFEWKLLWGTTLRGEVNAVASHNAYLRGEALLGLGLHF